MKVAAGTDVEPTRSGHSRAKRTRVLVRMLAVLLVLAYLGSIGIAISRLVGVGGYGFAVYSDPSHGGRYLVYIDASVGVVDYSGLRTGDQILAVDGVPAARPAAFEAALYRPRVPGEKLTLLVQRVDSSSSPQGSPEVAVLTTYQPLSEPGAAQTELPFVLFTLAFLAVAVTVALLRPDLGPTQIFLVCSVGFTWSGICLLLVEAPSASWEWISRLGYLLDILAETALLHFFLIFPEPAPIVGRLTSTSSTSRLRLSTPSALALLYGLPLLAEALVLTGTPPTWAFGAPVALLPILGAGWFIIRSIRRPATPVARAQLRWVLWAGIALILAFLAPILGQIPSDPRVHSLGLVIGPLGIMLLPIALGLAVLRYGLFEVDRVLRLTVTYAILASVLIGAYALLVLLLSRVIEATAGPAAARDPALFVIAALAVGLSAPQVQRRMTAALDRLLFRERLGRRQLLAEATEVFENAVPPETVAAFLVNTARARLDLANAWLVSTDGPAALTADTKPIESLILHIQHVEEPSLLLSEPIETGGMRVLVVDDADLHEWFQAGARIIVPLRVHLPSDSAGGEARRGRGPSHSARPASVTVGRLLGVWILGERRSRALPEREDLVVVKQVGRQAAVLLDYARLGRELVNQARIAQDLGRAREIQQQMLPSVPSAEQERPYGAVDLAWRFKPAQEVSGDFYDIFPLPAGDADGTMPLQIAIGDVEGKSIGAALVMALAQATIRMAAIARPDRSPSTALRLANQLLRSSWTARTFVACALAVVESRGTDHLASTGLRLRLSNAAQIPPVLCRDGQSTELVPGGERVPLGILDNPDYQELVVDLLPGDAVIFASDGLPEAPHGVEHRASSDEIFGFARLTASILVHTAAERTAAAITEGIWNDVIGWAGESSEHDDMTLLVLRVRD